MHVYLWTHHKSCFERFQLASGQLHESAPVVHSCSNSYSQGSMHISFISSSDFCMDKQNTKGNFDFI